jgi:1-acyl-sn-glycerol-3-phosphate acyltransferase
MYEFAKFIFWVSLKLFFRFDVKGKENIPSVGGFILAGNHVSYLDPIVFGVACPLKLNYMARDTLFRNPFAAWALRHANVFPLKRNSADVGALKEALRRLKSGGGILLFPEGTRSVDGEVQEALQGVGFLARKSGVTVVPAFVKGTQNALPKGAKSLRPAPIEVIFGKPVVWTGGGSVSDRDITQTIMQHIVSLNERMTYGVKRT